MEETYYKMYDIELINGRKGMVTIPKNMEMQDLLSNNDFIRDQFSENFLRTNSIIRYKFIDYHTEGDVK